VEYKNKF